MKAWRTAYEDWHAGLPADTRYKINAGAKLYAFGRTENSACAAKHLPLAGVIDDFAAGTEWHGLPVLHGDEVPADAIVISTILHRYPQSLARLTTLRNHPAIIDYCDFMRAGAAPLDKVTQSHQALAHEEAAFADLRGRLDPASQAVLDDVMLFRLTGDPAFMANYAMREHDQYFDIPLTLPPQPIFIDGGAYQGETTENFITRFPGYGGAHVFEPTPKSLEAARSRLSRHHDITFHPCALGDTNGDVSFDTDAGTSARALGSGGTIIPVRRLDDEFTTRADFIKYDLEGYEVKALAGAAETIRRDHPALAICVYHDTHDFVTVPRQVFAIRDDYTLALRHYTQGWNETVLYFIPTRGR